MNSISRLFANQTPDYILLTKSIRRDLVYSVMLYMFRVIDSPTLSKIMKTHLGWSGQECIDFRFSLRTSGQIQRDLKLYAYAKINASSEATEGLVIPEADKSLVKNILRSKDLKAVKLVRRCRYYNKLGYKPKSISVFSLVLDKAIRELDTHCKKFVNRKFLFLTQSGQLGKEDIRQGFLEFGVYAIYKAYPVIKTSLHMVNIAKTAIHNRGMNVIKEQTTVSRRRLSKQKDGTFAGTLISLGQLLVSDHIPDMGFGPTLVANCLVTGLDGRTVDGEQFTDVDRRRDLEQTVNYIFENTGSTKKKRFMNLLMGVYDEAFSDWLGQPNDEVCSKLDRKIYANKVRAYLGVPIEHAREFVQVLRTQLQDFRN
jgi:hypothetical protein